MGARSLHDYHWANITLLSPEGATIKCCYMDGGLIENDHMGTVHEDTGYLMRASPVNYISTVLPSAAALQMLHVVQTPIILFL